MDYNSEAWIKVYTRDTAAWRATSLAARGLALELSRAMGRFTDEVSLGAKGLRAVASLVSAPWDEVEPLLRELIADGRLEYDEEQQTLRDPEHLQRQGAVSASAIRMREHRRRRKAPPSVTVTSPCDDQREEIEQREESETRARTPEGFGDVSPEPDPQPPPEPVAPVPNDPPEWLEPTLAGVELATGETFDRAVVWLAYRGNRERDRRPLGPADFGGFLGRWASKAKADRIRQRERDASGPRLAVVRAHEPPPAPYHATFKPPAAEEAPASRELALEAAKRLASGAFT